MSFLAGRLAATEGSYFLQQSKNAVGRLAQKLPPSTSGPQQPQPDSADVLPEILRHSFPLKGSVTTPEADSSLSTTSRWLPLDRSSAPSSVSPDALNPLRAYVKLPPVTFGPKRWQVPDGQSTVSASTANDLRCDKYPPMDSEKLKALATGYTQIVKAFAIATTIVFGGSAILFAYTAKKLQMSSTDDIRSKGRDLIQPGAERIREQMDPLRNWAEKVSRKWHIEGGSGHAGDKSILKELSKTFGARMPDRSHSD